MIIYFALQILFVIGNKPAKKSKFYLQKFMKIFAVFARNKKNSFDKLFRDSLVFKSVRKRLFEFRKEKIIDFCCLVVSLAREWQIIFKEFSPGKWEVIRVDCVHKNWYLTQKIKWFWKEFFEVEVEWVLEVAFELKTRIFQFLFKF